ncbi:hypothetical protein FOA24_19195 [Bacillus thuringiensis]|uniref:hypothetical protein n=1 Tax=Bacillus thuringiensis TaxID=1428 RepID=UPI00333AE0C4
MGMKYYQLKNENEKDLAVIKAHSGYEALGYYMIEKSEEALQVEDINVRKIHLPQVSKFRAMGVPYFDLSY